MSTAKEEFSRQGTYVEEQDGAGLSLSFQRTAEVRERSGASIEVGAVRKDAACMYVCMYKSRRMDPGS